MLTKAQIQSMKNYYQMLYREFLKDCSKSSCCVDLSKGFLMGCSKTLRLAGIKSVTLYDWQKEVDDSIES